jgi:hemerythrin-like domain-containing protein
MLARWIEGNFFQRIDSGATWKEYCMSTQLDSGASAAPISPRRSPETPGIDVSDKNLAYVLRYFDLVMEEHARVESSLFPALRQRAGARSLEVEALLAALLVEHARISTLWEDQLRPAILAALDAKSGRRGGRRLDTARFKAFIQVFRAHVDREERELLPLAQKLLGKDYGEFCRPRDF